MTKDELPPFTPKVRAYLEKRIAEGTNGESEAARSLLQSYILEEVLEGHMGKLFGGAQ